MKLTQTQDSIKYQIELLLLGKHTAVFIYSDKNMADAHYTQLSATMCLGTNPIKEIKKTELNL